MDKERDQLLRDMRVEVVWTDKATMSIPLYERMKDYIARARVGKGEVDRAFDDGARFAIAMKSAKPVDVGELASVVNSAGNEYMQGNWMTEGENNAIAQAILNKYNVTEK